LYNNSDVEKIYGMAYIFTLLMFRKPNKTTINKHKTTIFYREYSCGKRNPLYPILSASFVSIVLYPIHDIDVLSKQKYNLQLIAIHLQG
jgi:hypothetical protein